MIDLRCPDTTLAGPCTGEARLWCAANILACEARYWLTRLAQWTADRQERAQVAQLNATHARAAARRRHPSHRPQDRP